ncbi:hypothetical protein [Aeromicrobium sp. Leaf245]|uniref:hypothetical protein n=1 Tax=Aeromicrobium sp. Leaf245 TaxID=1736306 RepID=UPI0006FA6860|nr:hypothetical protein [Aeromicrobium sp. Leaf245]KQO39889.1 hypothetical protein ASF05_14725 [Aeromicrobium sp. Leaf245]
MTNDPESQALHLRWSYLWKRAEEFQLRGDTSGAWDVQAGSQLARDDRRSNPFQTSHACQTLIHAAVDHFHALVQKRIETGKIHTYAEASLARAVVEAGSTAIWILGPADSRERVARSVRWNFQDMLDERSMILEVDPGRAKSIAVIKSRFDEIVAENHLIAKDLLRPIKITGLLKDPGVVASMGTDLPGPLQMWKVMSGLAHARRWAMLGFSNVELTPTEDEEAFAAHISSTDDRIQQLAMVAYFCAERAIELYDHRRAKVRPPGKEGA